MASGTDHRTREIADLLDGGLVERLDRVRAWAGPAPDAEALLARLDALDRRRIDLRDRLDDMPDTGGAWGIASDTPLAGLADVLLRVQRLEELLTSAPDPASVAAAERVAAEPLPRPVRMLARQWDVLERARLEVARRWLDEHRDP